MKSAPFKEGSLYLSAIGGAIMAAGSVISMVSNTTTKLDDDKQDLCIIEGDKLIESFHGSNIHILNDSATTEIAAIRTEMTAISTQIRDVTPLVGRIFDVKVEKSYALDVQQTSKTLPSKDFKPEYREAHSSTYDEYGSTPHTTVMAQCESLQHILKISDQPEGRLPVTFKEELAMAISDKWGTIIGLIIHVLSLWRLSKRRDKKKEEKKVDLETFSTMQTGALRIVTGGFRDRIEDNSSLEAAKLFLLHLKENDSEKYFRWISVIAAKAHGQSNWFSNVEPSWKIIFKDWTRDQLLELLAELDLEDISEEPAKKTMKL